MPGMKRRLDFADHRRDLGDNRYIYAVVSRRARGLSIGINLNPDKVCNFDCPYCQVDRRVPGGPADIDLDLLEQELDHLLALTHGSLWAIAPFDTVDPALRRVADIAFAGDGEPTSPPEFAEAARRVQQLRDQHGLSVPIRLLTNATLLHRERVQAGLAYIDEPWCKLDAGTEAYFQLVDGTRFPFNRVLQNLRALSKQRPIVLQSMFLKWEGQPASPAEQEAWLRRLTEILEDGGQIQEVQAYTVARRPADDRVQPVERAWLESLADRARGLGLKVEVYAPAAG